MSLFRASRGFISGFVVASVLFGGAAMAADVMQREIPVSYLPLKFMFDGVEKAPPTDQQGFTYNSRTFVPLRFMAEALGKKVDYDPSTYTIYVGRRPAPLPEMWGTFGTVGSGAIRAEYFTAGTLTRTGMEMPNTLLLSAVAAAPESNDPGVLAQTSEFRTEITLDGKAQTLKGTWFVPDNYFGRPEDREIARVIVLDERNQQIYSSETLKTSSGPVQMSLPVSGRTKVRLVVTFYHNQGYPIGDSLVASHIGVSDLKWE